MSQWTPNEEDATPGPEEANRQLCEAVRSGDLDRLRKVVGVVLGLDGYLDPARAEAERRHLVGEIDRSLRKFMECLGPKASAKLDTLLEGLRGQAHAPIPDAIPLMVAAKAGFSEGIRLLVELGAEPTIRDDSQRTALWCAGSAEVVRLLVELGLDLKDVDVHGWTPLTHAAGEGLEGLNRARWLIEAGADVNATHDRGFTVFMAAAAGLERHVEMLRLLATSGANPHAVSELGYNAFHAAVDVNGGWANAEESVRSVLGYLKALGVSLTQRDHRGWTPLERARYRGTELEVQVLEELGA